MTFPAVLRPRHVAWLLLALIVIWFGNLEYRKLIKPDEGRYAEIPREMVVTGNWVTPRLNGIKYFEKPPLQYWATAVAYEAFGQHQWTARLWP
ncbi:MAG: ArnT family glycosyltransferase, partial [Gammaproteobacteria bacterium]